MNSRPSTAALLLTLAVYIPVIGMVIMGRADGLATAAAPLPLVIGLFLLLMLFGAIFVGRYWPHFLLNPITLLTLNASVAFGVHATMPAMTDGSYPASALYPFYYALVIAFAAGGNFAYWIAATALFGLVESFALLAAFIPLQHSTPHTLFPLASLAGQLGSAGVLGGIAYLVTAGRSRAVHQDSPLTTAPRSVGKNPTAILPATTMQSAGNRLSVRSSETRQPVLSDLVDAQNPQLDDVLASVVFFMSRNFKAYSALGFIYLPDKQALALNAYHSRSIAILPGVEIRQGEGVVGMLAQTRQSFISGDLVNYTMQTGYYNASETINSVLASPILGENRELLGALVLDSKDRNAFNDQHREILNRFTTLAAALITNVRMRIITEQSNERFKLLYEASHKYTTAVKPLQVLEVLLQFLGRCAPADRLLAVTFSDESRTGTIRAIAGTPGELQTGATFSFNDGLYSMVYRSKQPVIIADFADSRNMYYRFAPGESTPPSLRSLAIIPLTNDKMQCRGAVSLECSRPGLYQGIAEQLLLTVTGNASIAFERAMLYQQMEMLATTDGLTGLCNHRTFRELLNKEVERAQRYNRPLAFLLMDIDHFKHFNDTYGHPVGDVVLKEIAMCIRQSVRKNDMPARYGGEEFAVILPEADEKTALLTAERIRSIIEGHVVAATGKQLRVTVSIGCACRPQHGQSSQDLIDNADKALYRSKQTGRNRVTLFAMEMLG